MFFKKTFVPSGVYPKKQRGFAWDETDHDKSMEKSKLNRLKLILWMMFVSKMRKAVTLMHVTFV